MRTVEPNRQEVNSRPKWETCLSEKSHLTSEISIPEKSHLTSETCLPEKPHLTSEISIPET